MIKVAHLITGLNTGGAEMMLYKLLAATDRQQFEPHVISMQPLGPVAEKISRLGIPVYTLEMSRRLPFLSFFKAITCLRQINPDLLQTWMYHADLLGALVKPFIPSNVLIWNIRHSNLSLAYNKSRTVLIARLLARLSPYLPQKIITCSYVAADVHASFGYQKEKLIVIPNGFETDVFKPDPQAGLAMRQQLEIPADAFVIGLVARFDPQKDIENFVQAAGLLSEQINDVFFVLCGRRLDQHNDQLVSWLTNHQVDMGKMRLLGERKNISEILNAFDLFALSSIGEGFPNVVGEAMACGKPCVVTDVGDAAFLLGEAGVVVPSQNASALADAWRGLYQSSAAEREHLGHEARMRIQAHFALPVIAKQYETIYREQVTCVG